MKKIEFRKRIKQLIKRERELVRRNNLISQKVDKYNAFMREMNMTLLKQSTKEMLMRRKLAALNLDVEEIMQFTAEAEERLKALKLLYRQQMESAEEQAEKKQRLLQINDKLHSLQEGSKAFIKFQDLQERLKGVALCENENNCSWNAFDIDPKQRVQADVQDFIWQTAEQGSRINQDQWEMLFMLADY